MAKQLLLQRATLRPNRVTVPLLHSKDLIFGETTADPPLGVKTNQTIFKGRYLDKHDVCIKQVPLVDSALAWNEAEILSQLDNHPFVPRFFGVSRDEQNRNLLVVTELLEQLPSVDDDDDEAMVVAEPTLEHVFQLAQTLQYMHKHKKICHRDVKMNNLLLGNEKRDMKLIDFDRSIHFADLADERRPVGTITHMAPELLCWESPYSSKIDVYAFGITMFELLHPKQRPFPNFTSPALPGTLSHEEFVKEIVDGKMRPEWKHGNADVRDLAERCWMDSPIARPDFDEICQVLARVVQKPAAVVVTNAVRSNPVPHTMQTIGSHTSLGHVRSTMEDASCILVAPNFTMLGVFDGLRNHHTSSFAARMFPLLYEDSLKRTFADTDALLEQTEFNCGSTATVVVVLEKQIKAGWLGDSSAYLFTKTKVTPVRYQVKDLIVRHAPEREDEKFRIEQCGGTVRRETRTMDDGSTREEGPFRAVSNVSNTVGIAISRAFGLFNFRPVISNTPEFITVTRRPEDRFLVVATDGLWDLVGLNEVLKVLRAANGDAELASKNLVELALDRGAHDNVSVVVAMM